MSGRHHLPPGEGPSSYRYPVGESGARPDDDNTTSTIKHQRNQYSTDADTAGKSDYTNPRVPHTNYVSSSTTRATSHPGTSNNFSDPATSQAKPGISPTSGGNTNRPLHLRYMHRDSLWQEERIPTSSLRDFPGRSDSLEYRDCYTDHPLTPISATALSINPFVFSAEIVGYGDEGRDSNKLDIDYPSPTKDNISSSQGISTSEDYPANLIPSMGDDPIDYDGKQGSSGANQDVATSTVLTTDPDVNIQNLPGPALVTTNSTNSPQEILENEGDGEESSEDELNTTIVYNLNDIDNIKSRPLHSKSLFNQGNSSAIPIPVAESESEPAAPDSFNMDRNTAAAEKPTLHTSELLTEEDIKAKGISPSVSVASELSLEGWATLQEEGRQIVLPWLPKDGGLPWQQLQPDSNTQEQNDGNFPGFPGIPVGLGLMGSGDISFQHSSQEEVAPSTQHEERHHQTLQKTVSMTTTLEQTKEGSSHEECWEIGGEIWPPGDEAAREGEETVSGRTELTCTQGKGLRDGVESAHGATGGSAGKSHVVMEQHTSNTHTSTSATVGSASGEPSPQPVKWSGSEDSRACVFAIQERSGVINMDQQTFSSTTTTNTPSSYQYTTSSSQSARYSEKEAFTRHSRVFSDEHQETSSSSALRQASSGHQSDTTVNSTTSTYTTQTTPPSSNTDGIDDAHSQGVACQDQENRTSLLEKDAALGPHSLLQQHNPTTTTSTADSGESLKSQRNLRSSIHTSEASVRTLNSQQCTYTTDTHAAVHLKSEQYGSSMSPHLNVTIALEIMAAAEAAESVPISEQYIQTMDALIGEQQGNIRSSISQHYSVSSSGVLSKSRQEDERTSSRGQHLHRSSEPEDDRSWMVDDASYGTAVSLVGLPRPSKLQHTEDSDRGAPRSYSSMQGKRTHNMAGLQPSTDTSCSMQTNNSGLSMSHLSTLSASFLPTNKTEMLEKNTSKRSQTQETMGEVSHGSEFQKTSCQNITSTANIMSSDSNTSYDSEKQKVDNVLESSNYHKDVYKDASSTNTSQENVVGSSEYHEASQYSGGSQRTIIMESSDHHKEACHSGSEEALSGKMALHNRSSGRPSLVIYDHHESTPHADKPASLSDATADNNSISHHREDLDLPHTTRGPSNVSDNGGNFEMSDNIRSSSIPAAGVRGDESNHVPRGVVETTKTVGTEGKKTTKAQVAESSSEYSLKKNEEERIQKEIPSAAGDIVGQLPTTQQDDFTNDRRKEDEDNFDVRSSQGLYHHTPRGTAEHSRIVKTESPLQHSRITHTSSLSASIQTESSVHSVQSQANAHQEDYMGKSLGKEKKHTDALEPNRQDFTTNFQPQSKEYLTYSESALSRHGEVSEVDWVGSKETVHQQSPQCHEQLASFTAGLSSTNEHLSSEQKDRFTQHPTTKRGPASKSTTSSDQVVIGFSNHPRQPLPIAEETKDSAISLTAVTFTGPTKEKGVNIADIIPHIDDASSDTDTNSTNGSAPSDPQGHRELTYLTSTELLQRAGSITEESGDEEVSYVMGRLGRERVSCRKIKKHQLDTVSETVQGKAPIAIMDDLYSGSSIDTDTNTEDDRQEVENREDRFADDSPKDDQYDHQIDLKAEEAVDLRAASHTNMSLSEKCMTLQTQTTIELKGPSSSDNVTADPSKETPQDVACDVCGNDVDNEQIAPFGVSMPTENVTLPSGQTVKEIKAAETLQTEASTTVGPSLPMDTKLSSSVIITTPVPMATKSVDTPPCHMDDKVTMAMDAEKVSPGAEMPVDADSVTVDNYTDTVAMDTFAVAMETIRSRQTEDGEVNWDSQSCVSSFSTKSAVSVADVENAVKTLKGSEEVDRRRHSHHQHHSNSSSNKVTHHSNHHSRRPDNQPSNDAGHSNSGTPSNNKEQKEKGGPAAARHYDWNSTHFFPDIHDINIPHHRGRKPRSCFFHNNELAWLDLGPSARTVTATTSQQVPQQAATRQHTSRSDLQQPPQSTTSTMVSQESTVADSGATTWVSRRHHQHHDHQQQATHRTSGSFSPPDGQENKRGYCSSDEENRPPPEHVQPPPVVVMAREAAQRRSRSMDDYLHIPHMDDSTSEGDSVASSPKVWRKNPLMVRKVHRSPTNDGPTITKPDVPGSTNSKYNTPPNTPSKWNRVDSSEFRNGHDASSGSRRSSLTENKTQSPRRLSDRGSPSSKYGSRGSSPGLHRRNSDRIKEQYEKFEELQQMRRALDSATSEESIPTLKHASEERTKEYSHIRRLSSSSQEAFINNQRPLKESASGTRRHSLTRREPSPRTTQQQTVQPPPSPKRHPGHGQVLDQSHDQTQGQAEVDGFDVEGPRLSVDERKALFEKFQKAHPDQYHPSVQVRHPQVVSRNQERREYEKRRSHYGQIESSTSQPVSASKHGAYEQQIPLEAEFKHKDRLQSSSFENIYDGVDLTLETQKLGELEYEPYMRARKKHRSSHERQHGRPSHQNVSNKDSKAEMNLFMSRGKEQTVFGVFGDSSLTRQTEDDPLIDPAVSRDQAITPDSSSSERRRMMGYDAKALIAEEKQKYSEYKAEYKKRQSSHSSDVSFSEEEQQWAASRHQHSPQQPDGLMGVSYPHDISYAVTMASNTGWPLAQQQDSWKSAPRESNWFPETRKQEYREYRGSLGKPGAYAPSRLVIDPRNQSDSHHPPHEQSHGQQSLWDLRSNQGRNAGYDSPPFRNDRCQDGHVPPSHGSHQGFYNSNLPPNYHSETTPEGIYDQYCMPLKHDWYRSGNTQPDDEQHRHVSPHGQDSRYTSYQPNFKNSRHTTGSSRSLEKNEDYWLKQKDRGSNWGSTKRQYPKPQSVPTSPINDKQNKYYLHAQDDNVRSSSAEGYFPERHRQQPDLIHHQQPVQRSNSWDRFHSESLHSHDHHPPSHVKAHGWPDSAKRTISTQPHGWSSQQNVQQLQSPSLYQNDPVFRHLPSQNQPDIITDWSYSTSGPTQMENGQDPKGSKEPKRYSNIYSSEYDDYTSLHHQQGSLPGSEQSLPLSRSSGPHEQYDFQSYKSSNKYSSIAEPQPELQPSTPPKKPARMGSPKKHDQYNRDYDLYADPKVVRQMKNVSKTSMPKDQTKSKQYPNDWSLPKSADELRKQFTQNTKERKDKREEQEKYTKFFLTARQEPSAITDVISPKRLRPESDSFSNQKSHPLESDVQIEKMISDIRKKYEQQKEPSPTPKKKSQLQFNIKTEHPNRRPACVLKADEGPEKPTPVNLGAIKANLFGVVGEQKNQVSTSSSSNRPSDNVKVAKIRSEVFNTMDEMIPPVVYRRPSSKHFNEDEDQRLYSYASYKDSKPQLKRSNIEDELTELERTYEQLNLNYEDDWEQALRHESATIKSDEDLKKIRRLSITNLRKLETLQQNEGKPILDYTQAWLASDAANAQPPDGDESMPKSGSSLPSQSSPDSGERQYHTSPSHETDRRSVGSSIYGPNSLPLKVGDDMAFRRQRGQSTSNTGKPSSVAVGSFLASPALTPATSMDSMSKRTNHSSHRSKRSTTPDIVYDDMAVRSKERLGSTGDNSNLMTPVSPSPTSTDYLKPRETAPARGRLRSRPEHIADKYHDDFAYRQLRKDVTPIKAELPKKFRRGAPQRSQSLDRMDSAKQQREPTKIKVHHQRSASISDGRQFTERRGSLSKGVAKIVTMFDGSDSMSTSAPDLTDESVFRDAYDNRGDIVSDAKPTSSLQKTRKHITKQQAEKQTPRYVKQRNEYKSRMKQQVGGGQRSEGCSVTESESDTLSSTCSSSGSRIGQQPCRSPPDGATFSDDSPYHLFTNGANSNQSSMKVTSSRPTKGTSSQLGNQKQVKTIEIPITRLQGLSQTRNESNRNIEVQSSVVTDSSTASPKTYSIEPRTFKVSMTTTAKSPPTSPQSPEGSQKSSTTTESTQHLNMSKEVHIHKLGTTSTATDQKPMTVNIVQTESKIVRSHTSSPLHGTASPSQQEGFTIAAVGKPVPKPEGSSIVKQQTEKLIRIGQDSKKPQSRAEEISDSMTVLEQWRAQAEQKKKELQITLEKELKEEKEKAKTQRIIYERQVLNQCQTTTTKKAISDKTKEVLEEKKHLNTVTQGEEKKQVKTVTQAEAKKYVKMSEGEGSKQNKIVTTAEEAKLDGALIQAKKLETQQLILKGQRKILEHRGLLPKKDKTRKVDTLDDLVANQPIASDFELEFSDYDNLETSDPEASNVTESDDSQKLLKTHKKLKRLIKSETKQISPIEEPKEETERLSSSSPPEKYERTEVTHMERTETATPDGTITVSKQVTHEVSSSGNETKDEVYSDNEENTKPNLGRRPSFKDIVQSFEDKAPVFLRKSGIRRCSSQDSVQQDEGEEFEARRLRDICGSEPNLRDKENKQKYHEAGGYYRDIGSRDDQISEF